MKPGNDGVKPGDGDGKAGSGGLIPTIGGDRGGNFGAEVGSFGFCENGGEIKLKKLL